MGTFWMFSVRRCAVTVISWIPSESVASVAVAACAAPIPIAELLKMAAIAYDNFGLEFINTSLHSLESIRLRRKSNTQNAADIRNDNPLSKNRIVISTSKFRQKQQRHAPERGVGHG